MPFILVRHKVQDYATWKPAFDAHATARRAAGSGGGRLFRSATDPNELLILLAWDSLAHAQAFTESQELREAMQGAGVCDKPDIYFLEEIAQPDA